MIFVVFWTFEVIGGKCVKQRSTSRSPYRPSLGYTEEYLDSHRKLHCTEDGTETVNKIKPQSQKENATFHVFITSTPL